MPHMRRLDEKWRWVMASKNCISSTPNLKRQEGELEGIAGRRADELLDELMIMLARAAAREALAGAQPLETTSGPGFAADGQASGQPTTQFVRSKTSTK